MSLAKCDQHFLAESADFRAFSLVPKIQVLEKVLLATFVMSLTIEVGQVILDLLIDANRVFELDDLWTNNFGRIWWH